MMTAQTENGQPAVSSIGTAVPFVIVALASLAVRTPLATAHPFVAFLAFLWIVSDTMMTVLIVRSSARPEWKAVLGVMAGACLTAFLGSPPSVRAAVWAMPPLVVGMAVIVLAHVALATMRAMWLWRYSDLKGNDRWIASASEIFSPSLVRLAAAELTVIHMAFFRWGGPADVPQDCRAFNYHKHLAPMCASLLIMSTIEIGVYHLLVGHWSRTAAVIMFLLSDVGFIYLVGLIKSFRFRPILVTPQGVRVRAGLLVDHLLPFQSIIGVETVGTGNQVRDPTTLNAALLAWPNILLSLDPPLHRRSFLKGHKSFSRIAFRLDDPDPFLQLLKWRVGQRF